MMQRAVFFVAACWFLFAPAHAQSAAEPPPTEPPAARAVAVTLDDLPVVRGHTLDRMQTITMGLLRHLATFEIPAAGFVNEQKLGKTQAKPERVALLKQWLDAGHLLGNHTYSHPKLYDTPLADFQADVLRGEVVTAQLLSARNARPRYFRHPYLNTGPDLETKTAFEHFLAEEGYLVAPVTIDNDEYVYALAYDRAETAEDRQRIGEDYVRYMEQMFGFYEQLSRDLLEREPAQILLLHANALNADYLDELAAMMQARGYRFVSLEEAMEDPVYDMPDAYVGRSGLSWLQRWWITQGHERRTEPDVPKWVRKIAYPDQR